MIASYVQLGPTAPDVRLGESLLDIGMRRDSNWRFILLVIKTRKAIALSRRVVQFGSDARRHSLLTCTSVRPVAVKNGHTSERAEQLHL
jgi:hypothetical protein